MKSRTILAGPAVLCAVTTFAPAAAAQWGFQDQAAGGDFYGSAVAYGDFDGDGYGDLAVGIPGEVVNGVSDAGALRVSYGGSGGVGSGGAGYWNESLLGFPSAVTYSGGFGRAMTVGDFDADGYEDLAVGAARSTVSGMPAGAVYVVYGSGEGLRSDGVQRLHQDTPGVEGVAESEDAFGWSLVSADLDGDGCSDLAVGAPLEGNWFDPQGGVVHVLFGSAGNGLTATGSQLWHRDAPGVGLGASTDGGYGRALTAGDFDGDGLDDLAIGDPWHNVSHWLGYAPDAGLVHVLYGEPGVGPTVAGQDFWSPAYGSFAITIYQQSYFGSALASGDLDHDGICDLAIGSPSEPIDPEGSYGSRIGVVHVLPGKADVGLQWVQHPIWHQDVPGVPGGGEPEDDFGASLAVGCFDGSGRDALVVGVPSEDIGTTREAGAVFMIHDAGDITSAVGGGAQVWYQDLATVQDGSDPYDNFGRCVAAGDLSGDGIDDLIIGVPGEKVASYVNAGAVGVLLGSQEQSVTATGDLLLHEFAATGMTLTF